MMKYALLLVVPAALWGQAFIDDVGGPEGLTPGGFAVIEGAYFDRTATVQVSGRAAAVLDFQQYYCSNPGCEVGLIIQLPPDLTPGPATLVLTAGKESIPFPITVDAYAPHFVSTSTAPYNSYSGAPLRSERALSAGGFGPWSCSPGGTPKAGELFRIYATGLGATDPLVPVGAAAPSAPLAATLVKPSVLVGGQGAEVVESVLAPGEIGVYRITFKVPSGDGWQTLALGAGGKTAQTSLAVGNAIQSLPDGAAAESIQIGTACGGYVANPGQQLAGDPKNPLAKLGGITVVVKDSKGAERPAPLLFVAQDQVEYIVPTDTSTGAAVVTVTNADGTVSRGSIDVQSTAPRVLEVVPGIAAAYIVRVRNGAQTVEPVFRLNKDKYEAMPIDLGPEGDQVYLSLFGTGWRFRAGLLSGVRLYYSRGDGSAIMSDAAVYAGPQGEYAGIDQVNVLLPRLLAGSGTMFAVHTFLEINEKRTGVLGLTYK